MADKVCMSQPQKRKTKKERQKKWFPASLKDNARMIQRAFGRA
jgi:hypothetical protein